MKTKILEALKTGYAQLGFNETVLEALADGLAPLCTDENLKAVVEAQKPFLAAMQKQTDHRVTQAAAGEAKKAEAAAAEAKKQLAELTARYEKALEDTKKAQATPAAEPSAEWKAEIENVRASMDEKYASLLEQAKAEQAQQAQAKSAELEELRTALAALQQQNQQMAEERKAAERAAFIRTEAEKARIPQWRIDEGLGITDAMDDAAVTEHLALIARNIKANSLPAGGGFPLGQQAPSKEEVDKMASNLLKV